MKEASINITQLAAYLERLKREQAEARKIIGEKTRGRKNKNA